MADDAAVESAGAPGSPPRSGSPGSPGSKVPDVSKMTPAELAARLEEADIPLVFGVDRQQLEVAVRALVLNDRQMPNNATDAFRLADIDSSGELDRDEVKILLAT